MAKSAQDYKSYLDEQKDYDYFQTTAQYTLAGASIGSMFGGLGAGIGALIGGGIGIIVGLFTSGTDSKEELRQERDDYQIAKDQSQLNRNQLISTIQGQIKQTRNDIDLTYGEGTFDLYDQLFAEIFNLPEGSSTLNDIFENASLDKYYGQMSDKLSGSYDMSESVDYMTLSDINKGYQEYLASLVRGGDTQIGLTFKRRNMQEQMLIESYYDDIDSYRLQMAQSFKDTFLTRVEEQAQGEMALGEASVAQAVSGIRQQGSGTNLTMQQQFQNDLASIAYASSLDYAVTMYQLYMETQNKSLTASVEDIRLQNSMDVKTAISSILNSINAQNQNNYNAMIGVIDSEKTYTEAKEGIENITEALGDTYKPDMEEIFQ